MGSEPDLDLQPERLNINQPLDQTVVFGTDKCIVTRTSRSCGILVIVVI